MCNLNGEELWLVARLYFFAISPVILGLYLLKTKNIDYRTAITLCLTFLFVLLDLKFG